MPLHDHFEPRFQRRWPWSSVHFSWAAYITEQLNKQLLPKEYQALPGVHLGGQAQVDVGTVEVEEALAESPGNGAVATAVWGPPQPPLVVSIDFADPDVFEVQVLSEMIGERRLVAAIELVSPSNKDRPGQRRAFAAKCAAYLQQGVGVIVVDVVTERHFNMHAELMQLLDLGDAAVRAVSSDLYAVAYRTTGVGEAMRLEAWPASLAVGTALPLLPLWIAAELAVPLDLEASYRAVCDSLRIRL